MAKRLRYPASSSYVQTQKFQSLGSLRFYSRESKGHLSKRSRLILPPSAAKRDSMLQTSATQSAWMILWRFWLGWCCAGTGVGDNEISQSRGDWGDPNVDWCAAGTGVGDNEVLRSRGDWGDPNFGTWKLRSSRVFLLREGAVFSAHFSPLSMKSRSLWTSASFTGFTRNSSAPPSRHLKVRQATINTNSHQDLYTLRGF